MRLFARHSRSAELAGWNPHNPTAVFIPERGTTMHTDIRKLFLVLAFSLTSGAALAVATTGGQTKEQSLEEACARADWPNIPAACIVGGNGRAFRTIEITQPGAPETLNDRFSVAFE
jgi:hypothetical protein